MTEIAIKSVASNRVRLKSDIFYKVSNLEIIQEEFHDIFLSFRENRKCKSIVFTHKKSIALDEIINKLNSIMSAYQSYSAMKEYVQRMLNEYGDNKVIDFTLYEKKFYPLVVVD